VTLNQRVAGSMRRMKLRRHSSKIPFRFNDFRRAVHLDFFDVISPFSGPVQKDDHRPFFLFRIVFWNVQEVLDRCCDFKRVGVLARRGLPAGFLGRCDCQAGENSQRP